MVLARRVYRVIVMEVVGQQIYGTSTARVSRDCDGSCCHFDYI